MIDHFADIKDLSPRKRETRHLGDLKIHPKYFYQSSDLQMLADSIKCTGLMQDIIINTKDHILVGGRRVGACRLLGWETIEVIIVDLSPDDEEAFMVMSNIQRKKRLTEIHHEIIILEMRWAKRRGARTDLKDGLSDEEKAHTRQRIADALKVSQSTIQRIMQLGENAPELLEYVDKEDMTFTGALNSLKSEPYKKDEDQCTIDLEEIKSCPFCGSDTKRIKYNSETGKLEFENDDNNK